MIRLGDIIIVSDLLDPRGRNPKDRPAVVVTPTEEIAAGGPIFVVAITTRLDDPLPEDFIPLPWSRPRHPRTGLNVRNAAVCRWLAEVDPTRILRTIGQVPNRHLDQIVEILRRWDEATGPSESEGS